MDTAHKVEIGGMQVQALQSSVTFSGEVFFGTLHIDSNTRSEIDQLGLRESFALSHGLQHIVTRVYLTLKS